MARAYHRPRKPERVQQILTHGFGPEDRVLYGDDEVVELYNSPAGGNPLVPFDAGVIEPLTRQRRQ